MIFKQILLLLELTHLTIHVSEIQCCSLLYFTEDREESGLHAVAVQGVLPSLNEIEPNLSNELFFWFD